VTSELKNELEHQYVKPAPEEVADGRDVAKLFLAHTRGLVANPYASFEKNGEYVMKLNRKEGIVTLIDENKKTEQIADVDDDGWIEFAKRLVKMSHLFTRPFRV
jgi:hypothetical protein